MPGMGTVSLVDYNTEAKLAITNSAAYGNAMLVTDGSVTAAASLTAATAVSNGTTVDFGSAQTYIVCTFTNAGTTSGGTVNLQVSLDGAFWVNVGTALAASGLAASGAATLATNVIASSASAFRYARAVIVTTITGGGTVSASIAAS